MKIYGITGRKDQGKTMLVVRLVEHFVVRGLRVATVKHAHAGFEIDHEGRDSYRHRMAGASQVLVTSPRRWALIEELRGAPEPTLDEMLARLGPSDLVLVEGFKASPHPKIEVCAPGAQPLATENGTIKAIAGSGELAALGLNLPLFDRNDVAGIAAFIAGQVGLQWP